MNSSASIKVSLFILLHFVFSSTQSQKLSQDILGAWETNLISPEGNQLKGVVIFAPGFQSFVLYDAKSGEFVRTNGGKWELDGMQMTETVEFDSKDSTRVGKQVTFAITLQGDHLQLSGMNEKWIRIDNGLPGMLSGAWLFSGRKQNEDIVYRSTDGPRKTMKIMSGTRFQWIAYHTETGVFSGTGGGTYETKDGKYTETIEFFSRDIIRVGANLQFNFELIDGNWHHSGNNSRGEPLYEVWTKRTK